MNWKYIYNSTKVAYRILDGGGTESILVSLLPDGTVIDPADIPDPKIAIQDQIDTLEREQLLPRVTREGLLLTMETFAAMQSITPAQLYASNIAYHKVKDFDTQITLLRAQL